MSIFADNKSPARHGPEQHLVVNPDLSMKDGLDEFWLSLNHPLILYTAKA